MNVFYDPKKKQTKAWILFCFGIVSIILIIAALAISKGMAERFKAQNQTEQKPDIFK